MVSDVSTPEHSRRQAREPASKHGVSCMYAAIAVAVLGIPVPGPQRPAAGGDRNAAMRRDEGRRRATKGDEGRRRATKCDEAADGRCGALCGAVGPEPAAGLVTGLFAA